MQLRWEGEGLNQKAFDKATGACIVEVDPRYFRPPEVETLLGDASKARSLLGWIPRTSFHELVEEMALEDLQEARRDELVSRSGFKYFRHDQ